jgi:predicted dehydrogenase/nucleoside-diphosphate-sugar epimerase
MRHLRLALVGCGAVIERLYLPALKRCPSIELAAFVDVSVERARLLSAGLPSTLVATSHRDVFGEIDAAIVAVPNHLHAPVAVDLLSNGVHILVEKPMAPNTTDCDAMIAAAAQAGTVLAVGQVRRFYAASQMVKHAIAAGLLGSIVSVGVREGTVLSWPLASDYLFRREAAGGGVLMDVGSHTLDLLLWWLGDWDTVVCRDDAVGGVEANSELQIRFRSGAIAAVEVSRNRTLRNTFVIRGERGTIEVGIGFNASVRLTIGEHDASLTGRGTLGTRADDSLTDAFVRQIEDFATSIRDHRQPFVPGPEARRVVALIEACYSSRRPLPQPWVGLDRAPVQRAPVGALRERVLVTGGTGFIGGRLVERLVLETGAEVRVLVRDFAGAARIGRLPVQLVRGDITRSDDVLAAADGCRLIFHCAYGNSGGEEARQRVNVDGTRNVLEGALRSGAARLVLLSTAMVYGATGGDMDESNPRRRSGSAYADSKLKAEGLAQEYARRGLPLVILQPTTVYGPFAPYWTVAILRALKASRVILVDGGEGLCNPVYVDDVVTAMLQAATAPGAVGETVLVSGAGPVPWREFFGHYERMLGVSSTVSMSVAEALRYHAQSQRGRRLLPELKRLLAEVPEARQRLFRTSEAELAKRVGRAIIPRQAWDALKRRLAAPAGSTSATVPGPREERPIAPLNPDLVRFCSLRIRVRTDKAERVLGYQPAFDLEAGMKLTEQWAKWAQLL